MSHNLNIENGKASLVVTRDVPWHGLGTVLPEPFTAEQALQYGGLDFEVKKMPALVRVNGRRIPIPGKFATVRMDNTTPLGTVGNYYTPLQNKDAFEFFDAITGTGEAIYETAGCLGAGEVVFISAKMPEYIKVPGDVLEMYLILTNSHNGTSPLTAFFSPVKVVCQNTVNAALRNSKHRVTIRHTNNVKQNAIEASKLMGVVNQYTNELTQAFDAMSRIKVGNTEDIMSIVTSIVAPENGEIGTRMQNIVATIMEYHDASPHMEGIRGTKWGVYNAVTGYIQNLKEYRTADVRMQSAVLGGADWRVQQRAFELCLK